MVKWALQLSAKVFVSGVGIKVGVGGDEIVGACVAKEQRCIHAMACGETFDQKLG